MHYNIQVGIKFDTEMRNDKSARTLMTFIDEVLDDETKRNTSYYQSKLFAELAGNSSQK